MKKIMLLLSFFVFLVAPLLAQTKIQKPNYGYPLLSRHEETLPKENQFKVSKLAKTTVLPSKVDWTAYMPPVGDQGEENSCTGFAATYALTALDNKEKGYSLSNQFSPSFNFNLSNVTYEYPAGHFERGGSLASALEVFKEAGCARLSDFPYIVGDYSLPSSQVMFRALNHRIESWHWFNVGDSLPPPFPGANPDAKPGYGGINTARQLLAEGKPVLLGLYLTEAFGGAMESENWIYSYAAFGSLPLTGGHALCLVGYDDSLETRDGKGAFLVINSWGADKFQKGYCWITYKMLAEKSYCDYFYTFTPKKNYHPKTTVDMQLDKFGCFIYFYSGVKVGGEAKSQFQWKYRWFDSNQDLITRSVIDITDLTETTDLQKGAKFFISGQWLRSKWNGNPIIKTLHIVDSTRNIDTIINANITVKDSLWYAEWDLRPKSTTGVDDNPPAIAAQYELSQNYPNPFNPTTAISFSIAKPGQVLLKVYDVLGREVATLINGELNAGVHHINFDAANLNSGIYIYQIKVGNFSCTKKMMLVK